MNDVAHRSWPLPSTNWIMKQSWRDVLFIHWPVSPDILRPYIPSSLNIDILDGCAWVGVVVFVMQGIYPRGLPTISVTPKFSEVNVRTYVEYEGKPGVYFLSLEVGDWASLTIAKKWYHLPYQHADISIEKKGQTYYYESIRKGNTTITSKGMYTPLLDECIPKEGTLDHWLLERYCLYSTNSQTNLYCGEIHHRPWTLQKVKVEIMKNTLFTSFNMDLDIEPIYHFSKGIDTLFWNIKRV